MKRISILGLLFIFFIGLMQLQAQDKKKKEVKGKKEVKEKTPVPEKKINEDDTDTEAPHVYNYVIDDPMDAFGPKTKDSVEGTRFFLFPEFYTFWPTEIYDTVLRYECYDARHILLNMDTIRNINDIHYISFIKSYNDQLNTIIDQEGKPRPTPVSKILYRYERSGADLWKAFDNQNNYLSLLQEKVNKIVRSDTTILTNPVSGSKQMTVRRYYKVIEIEKANVSNLSEVTPTIPAADPSKTVVQQFSVPEFYFHTAKQIGDTTLEFACYDKRDSIITDVENFDAVHYYSLFKKFADPLHTYNDNGVKKPLPTSVIIKRYDQTTPEKWICVEYPGNKFTNLKGFKTNVVATDTVSVTDPATDVTTLKIYNYFKVIKN